MNRFAHRRTFLFAAASLPLSFALPCRASEPQAAALAKAELEKLETGFGGRIGLFALNTVNGTQLVHRADERFPFCSTFKVMVASAILTRSVEVPGLLQQRIRYRQSELVNYSPIAQKHITDDMTVAGLCAAALQYSDNTAANLLIRMAGGPQAVTAFARSIGDGEFRLDRWETELNTAIPGDVRDTSTPGAMGRSLQRLVLGDALASPQREQLRDWLYGNTTGAARIKAGIPADWKIGDKTGSGDYGTANDIAVVWPLERAPVVVAIYTTQARKDAKSRDDVIASAAKIVAGWLGPLE
jgi:beta-lactamase class A